MNSVTAHNNLRRHCGGQTVKMAVTPSSWCSRLSVITTPHLRVVDRTCDSILVNRMQQRRCDYMDVTLPNLQEPLSPWLVLRKQVGPLGPRWQGTEGGHQSSANRKMRSLVLQPQGHTCC